MLQGEESGSGKAAEFYAKSISLSFDPHVLTLLESLPAADKRVKDARVRVYRQFLEDKCYQTPNQSEHVKTIHLKLALMLDDDLNQSVSCLRQLLSISQDPIVNEMLGERYLRLGKYTSAFKAFKKADDMEHTAFRQTCIGDVLLILHKHEEAMELFLDVLSEEESNAPALLGCIKSLYLQAEKAVSQGRFPHANYLVNSSLIYISKLIQFKPRWAAPWKYLGDMCLLLDSLNNSSLSPSQNVRDCLNWEGKEVVKGSGMLHLATKCYSKGIELQPACSEFLLDLGKAFLLLADFDEAYLLHSVAFSKRAVNLRPSDHKAWTLLGCACLKRRMFELAQHALIRSLNLEKRCNPSAWTNLGVLYLIKEDYELANLSFSEAQSNDPKYAPCWVAQAFLAKVLGDEEISDELFRDIARDVTRKPTVEGTLSYATQFCKTNLSGPDMSDVVTLVTRSTFLRHPDQWLAHNLAGVLYGKLRNFETALHHSEQAIGLCPGEIGSVTTKQGSTSMTILDNLANNKDKIQYKLGNYSLFSTSKQTLWSALAMMRSGGYGPASSILDNLPGEDSAVFQAVLSWISGDHLTAASFLEHVTSTQGCLIKSFILGAEPPSDMVQLRQGEEGNLMRLTALLLHLHGVDHFPRDCDTSLSHAESYIVAKYLVAHQEQYERAGEILKRNISEGFIKEDVIELLIDCLRHNEGESVEDEVEDSSVINRLVQKSYHMFPWRLQSQQLFADLRVTCMIQTCSFE